MDVSLVCHAAPLNRGRKKKKQNGRIRMKEKIRRARSFGGLHDRNPNGVMINEEQTGVTRYPVTRLLLQLKITVATE